MTLHRLWRRRRADLGAVALLTALLAAAFLPYLAQGRVYTTTVGQQTVLYPWAERGERYDNPTQEDLGLLSLPLMRVQDEAYGDGDLPAWDPSSYLGGAPLYADLSTGQAYLPRIVLVALFEPFTTHLWFTLLHLWVAGVAMFAFARSLGLVRWAGVIAGSAWMLSAWNLAWAHLAPVVVHAALLPVCLLAVHEAHRRGTFLSAAVAGLPLATSLIAGQVLFGYVSALVAGVWWLFLIGGRLLRGRHGHAMDARAVGVALARPALAVATGVATHAVILLPLAATLSAASRSTLGVDDYLRAWPASTNALRSLVWPDAPPVDPTQIDHQAFVGHLALALAGVGLVTRGRAAALGRALAIGAALLTAVPLVVRVAYVTIPGFRAFRPYDRFSFVLAFGVALLAGVGADRIIRRRVAATTGTWHRVAAVALAMIVLVNAAQLADLGRRNTPDPARDDPADLFATTPVIDQLIALTPTAGWPVRVASLDDRDADPWIPPTLAGGLGAWFGVESARGYNSLTPDPTVEVLRLLDGEALRTIASGPPLGSYIPALDVDRVRVDLLTRFGVTHVVTPPSLDAERLADAGVLDVLDLRPVYAGPDGRIWEIPGVDPGPWAATSVVVVDDDATLAAIAAAPADRGAVVIGRSAAERLGVSSVAGPITITVHDVASHTSSRSFRVTTSGAGLVVIPVNAVDGWTITVDGREVPWARVNHTHIGVVLPAGDSQVSMRFTPPGLRLGAAISLVVWTVLIAGAAGTWRRRRVTAAGRPWPSSSSPCR